MKTVFQRALSVILCVLLAFSTTTLAFAADGEDFDYKTYAENAVNENVHYLLDSIDATLEEENIYEHIVLGTILGKEIAIDIDLRSIDAIFGTLDDFRGVLTVGKVFCGDLADLNLNVLDQNLTRAGSGDVKIISELLEFAAANGNIISGFIDGTLDLGTLGELLEIDISTIFGENGISGVLREAFVESFYTEGSAEYNAAMEYVYTDFDKFVYTDIVGSLLKDTPIKDVEISETTTVNTLITDIFALLIENYLIDLVDGQQFDFNDAGEEYAVLNDIIILDGEYDFTAIQTAIANGTVLDWLNNVLGLVVEQLVPAYDWTDGNYTKIGDNVRGLVRYIAEESGMIKDENGNAVDVDTLSDDTLVLEIAKLVFFAADQNGEKEIYNVIKDKDTLDEAVNAIFFYDAAKEGYTYSDGATYENVLGDYLAGLVEDAVPLYDEKGNAVAAGDGKSVWDVANYILNFYLVDKNLDALIGFETDKGDTVFEKLDLIFDLFADDGTADFDSEDYITSLLDSLFTVDLQSFVNLTAAKALNYAGDESVIMFIYEAIYNILNNWTGSSKSTSLNKYTTNPFENTISNSGIANIVKVVIEVLSARSSSVCMLIGLIHGAVEDIFEDITPAVSATCTSNGKTISKYCADCNRTFYSKTVSATGHKYDKGTVTKKPTCTAAGVKTYKCTVCGATKDESVPATGHKAGSNAVVTKAATCTAAGTKSYKCTVCGFAVTNDPIPATGHKYDSGKITKAATYVATGVKTITCTVCKATYTETVKKLTLGKVKDITVKKATTKAITYTWTAVTGATGYTVQYTTNNGLTWNKVEVTTNSVTIKKLKAGATCKVKITATIGKKAKSAVSNVFESGTKPAKASIKALTSSAAKKAVVTWKAVSGANGYEVMYSTSKKFKKDAKKATVKKASAKKTTLKKLKSGKKYFVKVRAYKTVNGAKLYGAWSKVGSVKVK